jgi:hypothetical protein
LRPGGSRIIFDLDSVGERYGEDELQQLVLTG